MTTGKGKWSVDVHALAEKLAIRVETVAQKVVFDVFSGVVSRSPVDTGRFRSNWVVSVGKPSDAVFETRDIDGGVKTESKLPPRSVMTEELPKAAAYKVGEVIYLNNNLPYAARLENGWSSTQAPQGMVAITVREYADTVNKILASTP